MKSVLMVAAVVVLGACATQSAERSDAAHGSVPAANAPPGNAKAARPAPVKCVRDMDCEGAEVCYEGYCRR
jgi:hypothetical protein